ncbi:MAG: GNAT family N-acetyltransferase [Frankiaceae bacterium]|nr:GNAT family N-acetyltransferase [Frankiaceae bacterium]
MLRTAAARVLDARDLDEVLALLARDPVADTFVASRVEAVGLDPWRLGAEIWGYGDRGRLESLCYSGANLVPCQAKTEAVRAFADRARRQGRRCSSLVGPAPAVLDLWRLLKPHWGRAREVRDRQPLMAIDGPPLMDGDPEVRLVQPEEIDVLMPACIEMFTEEVGVSPLVGDGGSLYRARVEELIATGRAFARVEDGVVVFKAEVGAATAAACQVQGVWVHPSLRRRGVGTAGMAAVVRGAQESIAPVVSLYVNDFNMAARRSYEKVGFREVGTFASVLF